METEYTAGIDFVNGKAIRNFLVDPRAADPAAPKDGQAWTTAAAVKVRLAGTTEEVALKKDLLSAGISAADYDPHALLVGDTNGDPVSLTVAPSTVVARGATGDVVAMTVADLLALLGVEAGANVNRTPVEILAALLPVDGAGSGLDADTLDGVEAADFQTVAAMSTYATTASVTTAINDLIGGAGGAYDTLLELQNEITGNDTQIADLLTQLAEASKKEVFADIGDGTATTVYTITHGRGLDCSVYVRSNLTNRMVVVDPLHTPNDVTIDFGRGLAVDEFTVIIQG